MDQSKDSAIFGSFVTGSTPVNGDILVFNGVKFVPTSSFSIDESSLYEYIDSTSSVIFSTYIVDDDTMSGSSTTQAPSQQSVIQYVSSSISQLEIEAPQSQSVVELYYLTSSSEIRQASFVTL